MYYRNEYTSHFITSNVGDNIPVIIDYIGLTGTDSTNYRFETPENLTANILLSPVSIIPSNENIIPNKTEIENIPNVMQQSNVIINNYNNSHDLLEDEKNKKGKKLIQIFKAKSFFCFSTGAKGLLIGGTGCSLLKN